MNLFKYLLLPLGVILISGYSHAAEPVSEGYLLCKGPSSGPSGQGACINFYTTNGQPLKWIKGPVCTGSNEEICADNIIALCRKTGEEKQIGITHWQSGAGIKKTAEACMETCSLNYEGVQRQFGGKCHGVISDKQSKK